MPEGLFNRVYQLFASNEPVDAMRQLRLELSQQAKDAFCQGYQLVPNEQASPQADRVLASIGFELRLQPGEEMIAGDDTQLVASVAARLGLLMRMLGTSWTHLSARRSFGVKTTRHQLIKAEFADLSSQCSLLVSQWRLRSVARDFQDVEEDHWQITLLTNRAEKLMGGHGYLLGATHTLSYLSMMLYSLYGKATGQYPASRRDGQGVLA
ncbi:hypothetical protein [Pseudomonas maumuensis]|uniref:Acyl-CoA dehydrogenase/oxidase C-terminal domain-containing protein n=1 Tax=Pseudomonas maumuensis TaxID=2842354 RepID=A0ABX8NPY1_9PSED|nr:hypothetical protein [Pseudomonas maumuensis]QXH58073.1 hypothetical protein KSS90_07720 [Pseudomonas maumuensis]